MKAGANSSIERLKPVQALSFAVVFGMLITELSGCSGEPVSASKDYDQECQVESDCVAVTYAFCGPCSCPSLALTTGAVDDFDRDNVLACPPYMPGTLCGPCETVEVGCSESMCVLKNCDIGECADDGGM